MNKNVAIIASALLLFLLHSCGVFEGKIMEAVDGIYETKWKLVELNGQPVADKVNGKEPFISFEKETKRYSASGGCNGMGGTFEVEGNKIKFSQGISTMMACIDMTVENGFRTIFGNIVEYAIEVDPVSKIKTLSLYKDKTTLAKFTLPELKTNAKLDGTWELDYISGPRIAFEGLYPNNKPTIQFDLEKSQISGNGSCNNYFGPVNIDGSNIKFGAIGATKMYCGGDGESLYFETLQKVNKFDVHGNQLTFIMGDIAIMRFKRKGS